MDYIDIKVRFRAHDPMLYAELASTNKRHRADLIRIYAIIGHAAMRGIPANVPEMPDISDKKPLNSHPLDKNRMKKNDVSFEGGSDGLLLTDEEYAEIGEGVQMMLNSNFTGG